MATPLTGKQEAFAQAVAVGSTYTAAYSLAGYSTNMPPKSIWEESSHLAALPKVSSRIQELKVAIQKRVIGAHAWNLDRIVTQAEKHLDLALSGGPRCVPAANGALEIIGRATGLLTDKAREQPQQPITRVVIVLDHGADAQGRPRITEAAYEVLPAGDGKAALPTVPDADSRSSTDGT